MKKYLHDNLAGIQNGGRKEKDQKKVSEFSAQVVPVACHGKTRCRKWSLQQASEMASKIKKSIFIVYVCH